MLEFANQSDFFVLHHLYNHDPPSANIIHFAHLQIFHSFVMSGYDILDYYALLVSISGTGNGG